jgi:hypothetical protein
MLGGQLIERLVGIAIVLNEDEIPEFNVPWATPVDCADMAWRVLSLTRTRPPIDMDF